MFRKPLQVDTESELYDIALRALMRRAHSIADLKKKLMRRTDNELLIQVVIARLKENHLIDDARYAQQFARQRTELRKQGKFRVARDLRARGVPERHIQTALAEAAQQTDESAVVRQRIERKLRSFRGQIDPNKLASLQRSLLRAGFSSEIIRREIRALTREDLPTPDSNDDS
ncbi:MAG TPA: regulatory protein RecX [Candidatus Acidoferrum sp.]